MVDINENGSEAALAQLRDLGWTVGVHNDYRLAGNSMTFWLLTHPDGRYVKGEGLTDADALSQCYIEATKVEETALPCDVRVGAGVLIRKGCALSTLLRAIDRQRNYDKPETTPPPAEPRVYVDSGGPNGDKTVAVEVTGDTVTKITELDPPPAADLVAEARELADSARQPHCESPTIAAFADKVANRITALEADRNAAVTALGEASRGRGEAEGKLLASELAGVVEGWQARAQAAEALAERRRVVLGAIVEKGNHSGHPVLGHVLADMALVGLADDQGGNIEPSK